MTTLWLILTALVVLSPAILSFLREGVLDTKSFAISTTIGATAALLPLIGFGDASLVWLFLFAQTMLFCSFVCISRMRQRKSTFLMTLMSIPSNGVWFIVMFALASAYLSAQETLRAFGMTGEFVALLTAAIAGALVGRMVGVQWMQWVEARWQVRTDSVGSPTLKRLDAYTPNALLALPMICLAAFIAFDWAPMRDVLIVMTLGLMQSGVYSINTRFANRDHPGWLVVTGLVGSVVFIVHWAYLIDYTQAGGFMPLALLVPYTIATISGATFGAMLSMAGEKLFNLGADEHVQGKDAHAQVTWHRWLLAAVAALCIIYIAQNELLLGVIGLAPQAVVLPFTTFGEAGPERMAALLLGGLLFFVSNVTHTLSSRAGNRDHAPYHAITCVLHGLVYFSVGTFVILNARFVDLIPLAAFGAALGQLFAMRLSMWMEKRLTSVMDVPLPSTATK